MRPLTPRQTQILQLIKDNIQETGMPPTRAEIANILGFRSPNAAEEHLKALAKKGVIEIMAGTSRGIRLVAQDDDINTENGLPLIGKVAAGSPILAQEHVEQHYKVDPYLFKPSADFLLRVEGDSMIEVGILDGDLLAVHKAQTAQNGQVVVARVEDEVTVKRYQQSGRKVTLIAENKDFAPIEVDLATTPFAIEGLAVGVVRNTGGF
ncbi:transcriptional repressor LexA [Catenovulum sediminis]|uniref:LexA repressor n=1 Tax=Catenovulum sediminis TaxID=1740262 RepID=A0ABV1RLP2_9ALTE|nr:transcriptional repressor LexA [Catenovulum sediminis]